MCVYVCVFKTSSNMLDLKKGNPNKGNLSKEI